MRASLVAILWAVLAPAAMAQGWGDVRGRIIESGTSDEPVPGVSVVVSGTDFGTASETDGSYLLKLPAGSYLLRFSAIGYAPKDDSVTVRMGASTPLDVSLVPARIELGGIIVEDAPTSIEPGVYDLMPEDIRNIPSPFKGFQSLKALPGVASNNEVSNQYSVRGGGFNENLIFINGFEVYMPFRPRQGEQEGLGLLNPEMADRVTLYTGGFPARYGGKLSSALEVVYGRPENQSLQGSASVSLLDADVAMGSSMSDGRLGWRLGIRKARAQHFFSTQELKGKYRPDYTDIQGVLGFRIAPGHEIDAVGIVADHEFHLDPQGRKTYFGIVSTDPSIPPDLKSFWIRFNGREEDSYQTRFGGIRLSNRISPRLRSEHDVSYFGTTEDEQFDVSGSAVIYQVDPGTGNPETGSGHYPTGNTTQEDFADNRIHVDTWTARGRWIYSAGRHAAEAGWFVRALNFDDRIDEYTNLAGNDVDGEFIRIMVDEISDEASLSTSQAGGYIQNTTDVLPGPDRLLVTGGLRGDYFSLNDEFTWSPRLSARYRATDLLTLMGSLGIYHQSPTYRELRGKPLPGETILGAINRDIRSQRSIQYVAGGEYLVPSRRLYIRGELFYKDLDRLISYDIENVRVMYSGENDSRGEAYGFDLRVRGELVPGLQSWLNYSFLDATEDFLPDFETNRTTGLIPRPSDQRHTVSLFVQDYVPGDPTWKVHLRGLFGSGLPYTPPVPGERVGIFVSQIPGDRHSARYPEYRRVDMGVTKLIEFDGSFPLRLELTAELLNVFDMTNTVAFTWVPNGDGIWQRVPTRLTPRTFNVRVRMAF